ncbi:hypothetical protein BZA70DRAFT_282620 [Myxozyma melibiosi]|uniref:Uncharacterized protein n=1 Tax=Myxozyma melibiosi TaxID=54550 RepID=A0ABR1F103_9ASCO
MGVPLWKPRHDSLPSVPTSLPSLSSSKPPSSFPSSSSPSSPSSSTVDRSWRRPNHSYPNSLHPLRRSPLFHHHHHNHSLHADLADSRDCIRHDSDFDEIAEPFEEDDYSSELEPLGRTYIAREATAEQHDRRYPFRRSLIARAPAPSSSSSSSSSSSASASSATSFNPSSSPRPRHTPIASELALNRTLMDYVHRLRRLREDSDEATYFAPPADSATTSTSHSIPDMRRPSEFSAVVDQIRAIGAVHDSELSRTASDAISAAAAAANSSPTQRYFSSLDLDGFYSSRLRLRRNAYAAHANQSDDNLPTYDRNFNFSHISFSPELDSVIPDARGDYDAEAEGDEDCDVEGEERTSAEFDASLRTSSDPEVRDLLHRFELLDDRIDLIRMARRELMLIELEANWTLDAMHIS